jgi:hypothetical protein
LSLKSWTWHPVTYFSWAYLWKLHSNSYYNSTIIPWP